MSMSIADAIVGLDILREKSHTMRVSTPAGEAVYSQAYFYDCINVAIKALREKQAQQEAVSHEEVTS